MVNRSRSTAGTTKLDAVLSSGAGSYSEVWAATDATGRAVAIKLINAEAMNQADPALHGQGSDNHRNGNLR